MATIFAAFGKSVGNNKGSIQNFGIVGITIATEEISKFIFFYCPCDYPRNQTYGSIFIWGPAIVLLIAGYLANRRTWRLTTGLCNRTTTYKGRKGFKRFIHFSFIFASIGVKSMIAPATWVVLAFLKGDYYACAHWPDPENDLANSRMFYKLDELSENVSLPKPCLFNPNPAKFKGDSEAEVIARTLRAESHIIGWFYLTLGMLFSVTIMFCMRCQANFSYEQSNYIQRYRKHEIELFEEQLDEKAKVQAERIVNGYFSKPRAKEDWDKIAVINDKVTHSKRGKAIYSPLHRYVNKEKLKEEEGFADGDLVKDAAVKKKHKPGAKQSTNASKPSSGGDASVPATQFIPMVVPSTQKVVVKPILPVAKCEGPHSQKPASGTAKAETSLSQPPALASGSKDTQPPPAKPQDMQPPPAKPVDLQQPTQRLDETTGVPPATVHDPSTSPSEVSPMISSGSTPAPLISQGRHSPTLPPATSRPPTKERPHSLPPSGGDPLSEGAATSVKETSLGDFGGYYSREDLRKSLSLESVDGVDLSDTLQFNAGIPDLRQEEDDEEYAPLVEEDADENPLLPKEM